MKNKKRLDMLLVEQGYADSRTKAQAIIMSGQVYVDGQKADKPGISYEETPDCPDPSGGCRPGQPVDAARIHEWHRRCRR